MRARFLVVLGAVLPVIGLAQQTGGLPALREDVAAEVAARLVGDASLKSKIDAETAARMEADLLLKANIDAETAARVKGDADTLTAAKAYADTRPGPVGPAGPVGPSGAKGDKGEPGVVPTATPQRSPRGVATSSVAFLKFGNSAGSTGDAAHKDWSDVFGANFSLEKVGGKTVLGRFVVSKAPDTASDDVAKALVSGAGNQVQIEICDTVGSRYDKDFCYLKYTLKDAVVTSFAPGIRFETLVLGYTKLDVEYHPSKAVGGGSPITVSITPTEPLAPVFAAPTPSMVDPTGRVADAFMTTAPTILGDSLDPSHKDWMQITALNNFAFSRQADNTLAVTGSPALTKDLDRASPVLIQKAAGGEKLTSATIDVCTGVDTDKFCYARFLFNEPRFTSYALVDGATGDIAESFEFEFKTVTATYYVRQKDGTGATLYTFTLP